MSIVTLPPPAKFACRQLVRVPAHVHSSQLATIAGMEWGTNNKHLPNDCWTYTLWWTDQEYKLVTEEILVAWQQR